MNPQKPREPLMPSLERVLATLAASACLFITIAVWRSVSPHQPMWPLPGLYFVEIPAVAVVAALAFLYGVRSSPKIAWIAAGICGSFAFMGLFSVGLLYIPISLMYLLLGVLAVSRRDIPFLEGFGPFLVAAVAQAAFMLVAIRVLVH
jgi:hypothetical protein